MICSICNKNRASFHKYSPHHGGYITACHECLAKQSVGNVTFQSAPPPPPTQFQHVTFDIPFSGFESLQKTLSGFVPKMSMANEQASTRIQICPNCGSSFEDFRRASRLGCSVCYGTHKDQLDKVIKSIHGTTKHNGSRPKA